MSRSPLCLLALLGWACSSSPVAQTPEASPEINVSKSETDVSDTPEPRATLLNEEQPSSDGATQNPVLPGSMDEAVSPVQENVSPSPEPQEPTLEPQLVDEAGDLLPQTDKKPSSDSDLFERRARKLFDAIVADDVELAMPLFFPLRAYEQVKDIPDPAKDWEARLVRAFKKDIHAYNRSLGKFRSEAKFEEVRVADELAKWVEPGKEVNKVGYYRVMRSVLVYRDHKERKRELGIITMISWRGEWYVIHLAPFK